LLIGILKRIKCVPRGGLALSPNLGTLKARVYMRKSHHVLFQLSHRFGEINPFSIDSGLIGIRIDFRAELARLNFGVDGAI
jgi:hypothetical protein